MRCTGRCGAAAPRSGPRKLVALGATAPSASCASISSTGGGGGEAHPPRGCPGAVAAVGSFAPHGCTAKHFALLLVPLHPTQPHRTSSTSAHVRHRSLWTATAALWYHGEGKASAQLVALSPMPALSSCKRLSASGRNWAQRGVVQVPRGLRWFGKLHGRRDVLKYFQAVVLDEKNLSEAIKLWQRSASGTCRGHYDQEGLPWCSGD